MTRDELIEKEHNLLRSDLGENTETVLLDLLAAIERQPTRAAFEAHRGCCGTEHDPQQGKLHGECEYCFVCGEPTGRAGRADDSLYIGDQGPYCEECYANAKEPAE